MFGFFVARECWKWWTRSCSKQNNKIYELRAYSNQKRYFSDCWAPCFELFLFMTHFASFNQELCYQVSKVRRATSVWMCQSVRDLIECMHYNCRNICADRMTHRNRVLDSTLIYPRHIVCVATFPVCVCFHSMCYIYGRGVPVHLTTLNGFSLSCDVQVTY